MYFTFLGILISQQTDNLMLSLEFPLLPLPSMTMEWSKIETKIQVLKGKHFIHSRVTPALLKAYMLIFQT